MGEKEETVSSLLEANSILNDEVTRLRRSNVLLRKVNSALRSANESMRRQIENAVQDDETFKQWCAGDFDPPVASVEVGLAETGDSGTAGRESQESVGGDHD